MVRKASVFRPVRTSSTTTTVERRDPFSPERTVDSPGVPMGEAAAPAGRDEILGLVDEAQRVADRKLSLGLGDVSPEQAAAIRTATGLEVEGYQHEIDNYAIRHALSEHGDAAKESARGQVALTRDDFALAPQVISSPDAIAHVGRTQMGREVIRYTKRLNGDVCRAHRPRGPRLADPA